MYAGDRDADLAEESVNRALCGAWLMLAVAVASPIAAALGFMRPEGEGLSAWLQRSGAITTVLSLLALETLAFANSRIIPPKGGYGDVHKLALAPIYEPEIEALRVAAIIFTILGTLLWGYGDLLPLG